MHPNSGSRYLLLRDSSDEVFHVEFSGECAVRIGDIDPLGVELGLNGFQELIPDVSNTGFGGSNPDPAGEHHSGITQIGHRGRGGGIVNDPINFGGFLKDGRPGLRDIDIVFNAKPDGHPTGFISDVVDQRGICQIALGDGDLLVIEIVDLRDP